MNEEVNKESTPKNTLLNARAASPEKHLHKQGRGEGA